jgi:hypothetical protein
MLLSVVILGSFTTETHAMAHHITTDTPDDYLHHLTGRNLAQTVVARRLEVKVEPIFHPDSYGYRPYRSALDAVAVCRERCWKTDWVIDLDIQKFLDASSHCGCR